MEEKQNDITDDVISYYKVQFELVKLKAVRQASLAGSAMFATILLALIFCLAVLLATTGFALLLSEWLNSYFQGFLLTAGIYFTIILLLFIFRRALLLKPLRNRIISALLNDDHTTLQS